MPVPHAQASNEVWRVGFDVGAMKKLVHSRRAGSRRWPFPVLALLAATASLIVTQMPARSDDQVPLLERSGDLSVTAELRDVTVQGGVVSGTIANQARSTLSDVRLLIEYMWVWTKDRSTGDNPGRSLYYLVPGEVPPGGELRFRYVPEEPLPERKDGSFRTVVHLVGFKETGP